MKKRRMKIIKNNSKNNWLITSGLCSLALGILTSIYLFFYSSNYDSDSSLSKYTNIPFLGFLLLAVIGAPIIEEISFRGGFSKSRVFKLLSIVGLIGFSLIIANNTITKIITFIFLCILIISFYKKNKALEITVFLLNAIIFSLFHLNTEDLLTITSLAGFTFRFGFAMFSIWICLNFNLFRSILFHAVWNTTITAIISIAIFFPDKTINHYEDDDIKVTWHRQSKSLKSTVDFFTPNHTIKAKNCNAVFLLKSTEWSSKSNDRLTTDFIPTEPFMEYNFSINLKDTITKNQDLYKPIKRFLTNSELIKPIKK